VDGKIKTVADGVSSINSRVSSLATASKKEMEERKKGVDSTGKDLNQKLQLLALLPLLIQQPSVKLAAGNNLLGPGKDLASVSTPDPSTLDAILPLLLISGIGGSGSSSGLSLGGDGSDGGLMILALALAFANKPTS
jgi:hypothetical protein